MQEQIQEDVVSYLTENFKVQGEVDPNRSLTGAGIVSSLSMITLICWIEESFGITIPPDDFLPDHFDTVNAISHYISSRKG